MKATLDDLVSASGLSPLFGKNAIKRAVERCGVHLERLSEDEGELLVGELEKVVAIFDPDGVGAAASRIRKTLGLG